MNFSRLQESRSAFYLGLMRAKSIKVATEILTAVIRDLSNQTYLPQSHERDKLTRSVEAFKARTDY